MPVFSAFTGFGFLEFAGEPSECEKVYNALCSGYRDPTDGSQTIDLSVGTHQEAKIYGWACAIGAARVTLRGAANELRPETSYCTLEANERKFGMSPVATDSVAQRQAALAAKQKAARGPRHEAVWEGLLAIFGSALVAYHPTSIGDANAWPVDPRAATAPGLFRRPDAIATSIRLLTAVTRTGQPTIPTASYATSNQNSGAPLASGGYTAVGQSFVGDGNYLSAATFYLSSNGAPGDFCYAAIYEATGTFGSSSIPTGEALARSEPIAASTLGGSYANHLFRFTGENVIQLEDGTQYVLVLEYADGASGVDELLWGSDTTPTGGGNASRFNGSWAATTSFDLCYTLYTGYRMTVKYENWNRSLVEARIVKGDVLVVDAGNLGLAERVVVLDASGEGEERTLTAIFQKPHDAGTYATTGTVPLWRNTKRHVYVVVSAAAAVDVVMVAKTNELFRRIMRAPTTWAIVHETSPGSGVVGPFKIGGTLGSPLGCVSLEAVTL